MKKGVTSNERNPDGSIEKSKQATAAVNAESARLQECRQAAVPWKKWGPYLSERRWGTVREDYSLDGNAWDYFSHDQARSRAYRWGEDGLAGISDNHGVLCFALALWNGSEVRNNVMNAFKTYRNTLADPYRVLFDRFRLCDLAIKVVGVGSAGTFCAVTLFMAADNDPLFLQVKQANASVLEPYAGKSVYSNHGQRVVMGQRLMQSASDMMLGWTEGKLRGRMTSGCAQR